MRSEIIETVKNVAIKFVHNEHGPQLMQLVQDVVQSKGWKQVFGTMIPEKRPREKTIMDVLAAE